MSFKAQVGEINSGAPRMTVRPAAALGTIATHNLFTITDTVLVQMVVGEVIADLQTAATTILLQVANTDRATLTALATGVLNVSAEPAGTLWQLGDLGGTSPLRAVDVTVPLATYALGVLTGTIGIVCAAGSIQLVITGADNTTGSAVWYCMWVPLQPNARVIAA